MNFKVKIGAALLAFLVLVAVVPAAAHPTLAPSPPASADNHILKAVSDSGHMGDASQPKDGAAPKDTGYELAWLAALGLGVAGTVTVTYAFPVSGTTPPTVVQARRAALLTAIINCTDADTYATITHNWGRSSTLGGDGVSSTDYLARFFPLAWPPIPQSAITADPLWQVTLANTNLVTYTKATGTGTGGTFLAILFKVAHGLNP